MTQVVVIDYGMGNLHSVSKALETVADSEKIIISSDLGVIKSSDKIVLPGVGAIKDCMAAFSEDLKETVLEEIGKKPIGFFPISSRTVSLRSSEKAAMQSFIAPTPGRTILSDDFITPRSEEIIIFSESATVSNALLTEWRFPIP